MDWCRDGQRNATSVVFRFTGCAAFVLLCCACGDETTAKPFKRPPLPQPCTIHLAHLYPEECRLPREEADMLRQVILTPSRITSFRGKYTRRSLKGSDPEKPTQCDLFVEYRFQDSNLYICTADLEPGPDSETWTHVRCTYSYQGTKRFAPCVLAGRSASTYMTRIECPTGVIGIVNPIGLDPDDPFAKKLTPEQIVQAFEAGFRAKFQQPLDPRWDCPITPITPRTIIDETPMKTLRIYVQEGESIGLVRDGQRILAFPWPCAHQMIDEVAFDADNRIRRVDTFVTVPFPASEIRTCYDGDPEDLRILAESIQFDNYIEVGGVAYPLKQRKLLYPRIGDRDEFRALREAGTLSDIELSVRMATAPRSKEPEGWILEFDPASLRINEPLTFDDFRLHFPEGSIVYVPGLTLQVDERGYLHSPNILGLTYQIVDCDDASLKEGSGGGVLDFLMEVAKGGDLEALDEEKTLRQLSYTWQMYDDLYVDEGQCRKALSCESPRRRYLDDVSDDLARVKMPPLDPKTFPPQRRPMNTVGIVAGLLGLAALALLVYAKVRG